MSSPKRPREYPWSHLDARIYTDRTPQERIEIYLNLARMILNDPKIPSIALASEAEGNLRLLSCKVNEATSPVSPACTQASFGFTIPCSFVNIFGTLSGAHAAHLFDRASFLLLAGAARQGLWDNSGVSTALSMYWNKPLFLDDEIVIDVEMETFSKSTCVVTGRLRKQGKDEVCITGQHSIKSIATSGAGSKSKL